MLQQSVDCQDNLTSFDIVFLSSERQQKSNLHAVHLEHVHPQAFWYTVSGRAFRK
jgi:hypothetical protein